MTKQEIKDGAPSKYKWYKFYWQFNKPDLLVYYKIKKDIAMQYTPSTGISIVCDSRTLRDINPI